MASVLDGLMQQLDGDTMRQLSQQLGTDESTTTSAVGAALPVLMGALAKNASSTDGAAALAGALDRDHDGSMLGDIAGMLGGGAGAGILKHVLGGNPGPVADASRNISRATSSEHFAFDLGSGWRLARRTLFVTLTAIVMLGLGIESTTTMFSITHGILRDLPVDQPEQLMHLAAMNRRRGAPG